jgi:hypothetical protein
MKKFSLLITILILFPINMNSQENKLPFFEIGDYPNEYSEANIVSRMICGLGYRYHWATESLNENDLNYKPSKDSRSTLELIEHIYSLSLAIVSTFEGKQVESSQGKYDYKELRKKTLGNLQFVKNKLKQVDDFSKLNIVFSQGENKTTLPFWNHINGPISDAIWHSGQIVTNRRASGNPINPKVNVFIGKNNK